ncbi:glycosyltransferase family 4 protein [Nodularia sphaerocarpa]|uniref:glycosyltransferase family 4 protein n=1 Tax=Nodularia sphaerocarpa TaxID=137816 RepID=UPI001EFBD272|nr:glycosyltransferase family 1 protein [Nodularia sphaerocarpa]MDB9372524.1 glycosyltransferase family 1 protein [Nodularia sphaerocarpa CS-585]MDB9376926.1 glycosyltransferase family 1 protein [Nodularia sphaerocarpa CS-585A2]ULP73655.1 Mannosylfructose-phosphate synthase [Nodularia sphaerocarpa UHCC 0038]
MKVVCDISLLGIFLYGKKCGLFRTAENFIMALKESKECDLTFCSSLSFETWAKSLNYTMQNQLGQDIFFIGQNQREKTRKRAYDSLFNLKRYAGSKGWCRTEFLPDFVPNFLGYKFDLISPKDLDSQNIFHSLYHRLPSISKLKKNINNFLTVHDIIPIMYPHLCGIDEKLSNFDKNFNLKQSLDSLNKESWIICISNSTRNDLCNFLENKIDPQKIFVISWGAAADIFYPCSNLEKFNSIKIKYNLPSAPYILSLSPLDTRKNLNHLIQCFLDLIEQEKIKDLYLVLAGDIPSYSSYDSIFKAVSSYPHLKERIIFTGYVDDQDLASLYSNALVFVYPSLYEGFGLPPLEAMQCGTPVITSNTSSLPEIVGNAGIMLDPHDVDGLCESLFKLYQQTSLQNILSLQSINQAQKFSWSKCIQETIAAYQYSLSQS